MTKTIKSTNVTDINHAEELRERISNAAYFLSEQRGFKGEHQLHDWLEAELKMIHKYGKA